MPLMRGASAIAELLVRTRELHGNWNNGNVVVIRGNTAVMKINNWVCRWTYTFLHSLMSRWTDCFIWTAAGLCNDYEHWRCVLYCVCLCVVCLYFLRKFEIDLWLRLWFLADRTNGRAIGTVLRLSVCRLSVCLWRYVLWLNGAS